jgi:hypothetical protein
MSYYYALAFLISITFFKQPELASLFQYRSFILDDG